MSNVQSLKRKRGDQLVRSLLAYLRQGVDDDAMDRSPDYVGEVAELYEGLGENAKKRLLAAMAGAMRMALRNRARTPTNNWAIRQIARLSDKISARSMVPTLVVTARLGFFGGHASSLELDVEDDVLFALAGLQPQEVYFDAWRSIWECEDTSPLWPVAFTGMRLSLPTSDAMRAAVLKAVERGVDPSFPLAEILWSYATHDFGDARSLGDGLSAVLSVCSPQQLQRCQRAFHQVGASEKEIELWVPSPSSA